MPMRAPSICPCGQRIPAGTRCPCQVRRAKEREASRPTAQARGYTSRWSRESKTFLALPGNESCACGCGRVATMIDHIVAPKGDQQLFWRRSNWQPFNGLCNTRKAIASEGGFGRPISAKAGGRVETFDKGPQTAWGPSRNISPKSDGGDNSQ